MNTYNSLMKAVIAAFKADTTMSGLISDRVYSNVPQNETFPYMLVSISSDDFSSKTFSGMEHTIQINVYSRKSDVAECGNILTAAYNILHRQESSLSLDTGTLSILQFEGTQEVFKDNDGKTNEGVARFTAIVT